MGQIFFSYSRKDSEFVDKLVEKLESLGVDIWVDRGEILAGEAWRRTIVEAIINSQVFVIVLSSNSIASENVTKELTLAEQYTKRVLPLVIEDVKIPPSLDYQLAGLHYQTFVEGDYEENFERLVRSLRVTGIEFQSKPAVDSEIIHAGSPSESEPETAAIIPKLGPEPDIKTIPETERAADSDEIEKAAATFALTPDPEVLAPRKAPANEAAVQNQPPVAAPSTPVRSPALPSAPPQESSLLQKIPVWLWAVGGFVLLIGTVLVIMSVFRDDNQTAVPTETNVFAALISETTVPPPTDTQSGDPTNLSPPFSPLITDEKGVEMVLIPVGSFIMGTKNSDALSACQKVNPSLNCEAFYFGDEEPQREVSLDHDFYIDKFEVTNERYEACVAAGACEPPWSFNLTPEIQYFRVAKYSQYPVVNVTWDAANAYCEWRGGRLPAEDEWEKAARGREDARLYPWGDMLSGDKANFCDANCGNSWANHGFDDGYAYTAPVGMFSSGASFYGVEDLAGNVSEWVADLYGPYPGGEADVESDDFGRERVRRGGSWYSLGSDTRVSRRDKNLPSPQIEDPNAELGKIGFRCVLDVP